MVNIPEVILTEGSRAMPLIGMGPAAYPFGSPETKQAIIDAIEIGYRHFDTAALYVSEESLGFIKSREELFITSKLQFIDAHPDLVISAIKKSLRNLKIEYLDLYLIHMPFSTKPISPLFPINKDDLMQMDYKVWEAMEQCQVLGLTRAIGVDKNLDKLLTIAKIPPKVNQVHEMAGFVYNPLAGIGLFLGNFLLDFYTLIDCVIICFQTTFYTRTQKLKVDYQLLFKNLFAHVIWEFYVHSIFHLLFILSLSVLLHEFYVVL